MVNFVFPVRTADGGTVVVYTGDRWMQAPDGKKAHEPQFWTRLEFDSTTHDVLPLRWNDIRLPSSWRCRSRSSRQHPRPALVFRHSDVECSIAQSGDIFMALKDSQ